VALATLTALEIVLGIDNIIFISIVVGRLPPERRNAARLQGLSMAMIMRILLLLSLAWMMRLTSPLFTIFDHEISGRDLILILVGVVLIGEGWEMHIPKGYIYFAMAFSMGVEMLNIRMRKKRAAPVTLHGPKPNLE
jgi:predicted tellurium resistance membrane protein TerC